MRALTSCSSMPGCVQRRGQVAAPGRTQVAGMEDGHARVRRGRRQLRRFVHTSPAAVAARRASACNPATASRRSASHNRKRRASRQRRTAHSGSRQQQQRGDVTRPRWRVDASTCAIEVRAACAADARLRVRQVVSAAAAAASEARSGVEERKAKTGASAMQFRCMRLATPAPGDAHCLTIFSSLAWAASA
jgi:hypothetical protein